MFNPIKVTKSCESDDVESEKKIEDHEKEKKSRTMFLHHNFVSALLNDLFGIQGRGGCAFGVIFLFRNIKFRLECCVRDLEKN